MSEEFQQEADLTGVNDERQLEPAVVEETNTQQTTTESVIEAILFASDEPLSAEKLAAIAEFTGGVKQVKKCIETLNEQYRQGSRAFRIEEIAGGYQMMTLPEYNSWLKKLLREGGQQTYSCLAGDSCRHCLQTACNKGQC